MSVSLDLDAGESSHEAFVELEEFYTKDKDFFWKETARWIKFEEDVEENANRWGKPHVPCLNFSSIQDVRSTLENGAILLDLDEKNLQNIAISVVEQLIALGTLLAEERDVFISVLLTPHLHNLQRKPGGSSTGGRRFSRIVPTPANAEPNQKYNLNTNKGLPIIVEGTLEEPSGSAPLSQPKEPTTGYSFLPEPVSVPSTVSAIQRQIPKNAEATTVLVGTHEDLTRPSGAFVRLLHGSNLQNLAEVTIPVRFLFILLGPEDDVINYHEVGRSMATLMSEKLFLDSAYSAKNVQHLLQAIDSFTRDSILIPPGDYDRKVLNQTIPILAHKTKEIACRRREETIKKEKAKEPSELVTEEAETPEVEDALERTGRFCGGLVRDVKRRFSMYKSDIMDSFNMRCVIATIFVYLACLAPAVSFGGLLYENTNAWMGVSEMIFATALCGIIFSLFAGQPLIIIGATGPLLVFEKNTFDLCNNFDIEYLPWRAWVGLWVMAICFGIIAFEGCFLIRYFTRFTEEIFALLISLIFIYDGLSYVWKLYDYKNQKQYENGTTHPSEHYLNTALFNTIVLFGTFFIAQSLRQLRHSHFFGNVARRIVSDFGVLIAIVAMVFLELIAGSIWTHKLEVPDGVLTLTSPKRSGWFVNPMGIERTTSASSIMAALVPAILVSILLFMEVEFCNVILDKKDNKLKKGPGYNLDLFIVGLLVGLCSILGLPWMCATPVHTVSHFHALSVLSTNNAPGEKPHLIEVKEQRVTNVIIHLLIGVSVVLAPVLRHIPVAVLFGVFIFLGVSSMSHLQLCERAKLLIISPSHHPDLNYVRNVSTAKMHFFTVIQIICVAILFATKLSPAAPGFPFFIICLIPLRKLLERFYEESELEELDNEVDEVYDSDLDDFESIHVPM